MRDAGFTLVQPGRRERTASRGTREAASVRRGNEAHALSFATTNYEADERTEPYTPCCRHDASTPPGSSRRAETVAATCRPSRACVPSSSATSMTLFPAVVSSVQPRPGNPRRAAARRSRHARRRQSPNGQETSRGPFPLMTRPASYCTRQRRRRRHTARCAEQLRDCAETVALPYAPVRGNR